MSKIYLINLRALCTEFVILKYTNTYQLERPVVLTRFFLSFALLHRVITSICIRKGFLIFVSFISSIPKRIIISQTNQYNLIYIIKCIWVKIALIIRFVTYITHQKFSSANRCIIILLYVLFYCSVEIKNNRVISIPINIISITIGRKMEYIHLVVELTEMDRRHLLI